MVRVVRLGCARRTGEDHTGITVTEKLYNLLVVVVLFGQVTVKLFGQWDRWCFLIVMFNIKIVFGHSRRGESQILGGEVPDPSYLTCTTQPLWHLL